ncbi:hypothetical protein B8T70_01000 [Flavobacterium sp. AJR]|nr:hypothetical protein B8T70_01000 [Flavobacterium sp. AJR]
MKTIKNINTFAICLPFVLLLTYPIFKEVAFILALYSTMLTGFLQFSIGVKMLIDNPHDRALQTYMAVVASFFILWLINHRLNYNHFLTYILFPTPLLLAIYLSSIIYKKPNQ